jgi:hypothetical protein
MQRPTARSSQRSSVKQPPQPVLRIYVWDGGSSKPFNVIFEDGVLRIAEQPSGGKEVSLRNVHRIVYFGTSPTTTGTPLLVVDVDDDSSCDFDPADQTVDISAKVLCLLSSTRLELRSETRRHQNRRRVLHSELSLNGVPIISGDTRVILDPLAQALDRPDGISIEHNFGLNASVLRSATGLELPDFVSTSPNVPHRTSVRFRKQPINLNGIPADRTRNTRTLVFSLRSRDISSTGGATPSRIRTFRDGVSDDEEISRAEIPAEWIITQRPSPQIGEEPTARQAHWTLYIEGIPTRLARTSWNRFAEEYFRALTVVQAGRPVSFLPWLEEIGERVVARWLMSYRLVAGRSNNVRWVSEPVAGGDDISIWPHAMHFLRWEGKQDFINAVMRRVQTLDGTDLGVCRLRLERVAPDYSGDHTPEYEAFVDTAGVVLKTVSAIPVHAPTAVVPVVRMGSLDLELAPNNSTASHNWFLARRESGRLTVHVDAHVQVSGIWPGGQDDPPGEEFVPDRAESFAPLISCVPGSAGAAETAAERQRRLLDSSFRSKRAVVIYDKPVKSSGELFLLRVREDVRPGESQAMRLDLISQAPPQTPNWEKEICDTTNVAQVRRVVVLDRNPFLVAQVRYRPFQLTSAFASPTVATWTNTGSDSDAWQLQFDQQPFCLVLPPQAIGEDMIKDRDIAEDPAGPANRQALKFNFAPPSRLQLDPRVAPTRFAEAPWNLRRLLGSPADILAGPEVQSMQYELLYGLSCNAARPAVRLAEVFARVGRIPARQEQQIAWPHTAAQAQAYLNARVQWADVYRRYLSRVGLFEPWNTVFPAGVHSSLVINERLSCQFRLSPESNIKNPFERADGQLDDGTLLGGATRGFESRNIYQHSVWKTDDPKQLATSSSAQIADLRISSLGGWGSQQVGFQNDLTKVFADVAMGRTYRYQLERLGRIACFWNLAKHVIVYERTVLPSIQFAKEQPRLAGWPVLRKVREYVEILEDDRPLPDVTSDSQDPRADRATAPTEADRKRCGFVSGCVFPKGAQYNVSGSWGSDVGDFGWKIPIWHPGADPTQGYTKPKGSIRIAGPAGHQPCDIANPENVYFYTQTKVTRNGRAEDPDRDPRRWDPVEGVDYVNAPPPLPRGGDFTGGDPRALSPADIDVPPAYGPCTFRLEPVAVTNVVAERGAKAINAVLDTITVARARVPQGTTAAKWSSTIAAVPEIDGDVSTVFRSLLSALPQDGAPTQELINELRRRAQAPGTLQPFTERLSSATQQVNGAIGDLTARIRTLETGVRTRLRDELKRSRDRIVEDIDAQLASATPAALERQGAAILQSYQHAIEERILLIQTLPGVVHRTFGRYVEAIDSLRKTVATDLQALDGLLATAQANVAAAISRAESLQKDVRDRLQGIATAGQTRPEAWLPDPGPAVREFVEPYIAGISVAIEALRRGLGASPDLAAARAAVSVFRASAAVRTLGDPTRMRQFVGTVYGISVPNSATFEWLVAQVNHAEAWRAQLLQKWQTQCRTSLDAFTKAPILATLNAQVKTLHAWVRDTGGGLETELSALEREVDSRVAGVAAACRRAIDNVATELSGLQNAINDALQKPAGTIEAELQSVRDRYARLAGRYLDQAAGLAGRQANEIAQEASRALSLLRAFGEPPRVPKLDFDRAKLAYYFKEIGDTVDLTPVRSLLDQGQNVLKGLKPVGLNMPTRELLDQLIPPSLDQFDVSRILPDFAGLDLRALFSSIRLPSGTGSENIRVTHGIDSQTQRGFVRADVDFRITQPATVFSIGPFSLQVPGARFTATSIVDVGLNGETRRRATGRILGDWQLVISGISLMTFSQTELSFDDASGVRFSVDPRNVKLPGVMEFLSTLMRTGTGEGGLTIGALPDGFQSVLDLPIPDVQAGAFGISNLRLSASFAARFEREFLLQVGCGLARRDAPFSLTVFVLGGGGFLQAAATYAPSSRRFECQTDLGITVSASLAIALGPIKGGVYVYFGVTAQYRSGGAGMTLGVMFLIRGEVSVLSIVSACISLLLEATYNSASGSLVGRGRLSISIRICWCFTLEVNTEVTYTLGSPSRAVASIPPRTQSFLASANALAQANAGDQFDRYAGDYMAMLA